MNVFPIFVPKVINILEFIGTCCGVSIFNL